MMSYPLKVQNFVHSRVLVIMELPRKMMRQTKAGWKEAEINEREREGMKERIRDRIDIENEKKEESPQE